MYAGLRTPSNVGGIITCSGAFPAFSQLKKSKFIKSVCYLQILMNSQLLHHQQTPIHMMIGNTDEDLDFMKETQRQLTDLEFENISFAQTQGGHSFSKEMVTLSASKEERNSMWNQYAKALLDKRNPQIKLYLQMYKFQLKHQREKAYKEVHESKLPLEKDFEFESLLSKTPKRSSSRLVRKKMPGIFELLHQTENKFLVLFFCRLKIDWDQNFLVHPNMFRRNDKALVHI